MQPSFTDAVTTLLTHILRLLAVATFFLAPIILAETILLHIL